MRTGRRQVLLPLNHWKILIKVRHVPKQETLTLILLRIFLLGFRHLLEHLISPSTSPAPQIIDLHTQAQIQLHDILIHTLLHLVLRRNGHTDGLADWLTQFFVDLRSFYGLIGCLERHPDELGDLLLDTLLRLLLLEVEYAICIAVALIHQAYACFSVLVEEGFGVDDAARHPVHIGWLSDCTV